MLKMLYVLTAGVAFLVALAVLALMFFDFLTQLWNWMVKP